MSPLNSISSSLLDDIDSLVNSNFPHSYQNCDSIINIILRYIKICITSKSDQQQDLDRVESYIKFIQNAIRNCKDCKNNFDQHDGIDTFILLCDCEWSFLFHTPSPELLQLLIYEFPVEIYLTPHNASEIILYVNGKSFNDVIIENGLVWPDPAGYAKTRGKLLRGKIKTIESYNEIIILDDDESKKSLNDCSRHIISTIDVSSLKSLSLTSEPITPKQPVLYIDSKGPSRGIVLRNNGELLDLWFVDSGETKSVDITNCYEFDFKTLDFDTVSKMYRLNGISPSPIRVGIIEDCLDCLSQYIDNECVADMRLIDNYVALAYHSLQPTRILQNFAKLVSSLYSNFCDNERITDIYEDLQLIIESRFGHSLTDFLTLEISPQIEMTESILSMFKQQTVDYESVGEELGEIIEELSQELTHETKLCEVVMNLFLRYLKLFTLSQKQPNPKNCDFMFKYISRNVPDCEECEKYFQKYDGIDIFEQLFLPNNNILYKTNPAELREKLQIGLDYSAHMYPSDVIDIVSPYKVRFFQMLRDAGTHWVQKEEVDSMEDTTRLSVKLMKIKSSYSILCEISDGRAGELENLFVDADDCITPVHLSCLVKNETYLISHENCLFRGKFIETQTNFKAKVLKIDEGEMIEVALNSFYSCEAELKNHPALVTECSLFGVHSAPLDYEMFGSFVCCVHSLVKNLSFPGGKINKFADFLYENLTENTLNIKELFMKILYFLIENDPPLSSYSIIKMFPAITRFVNTCNDEVTKTSLVDCVVSACEREVDDPERKEMITSTINRLCFPKPIMPKMNNGDVTKKLVPLENVAPKPENIDNIPVPQKTHVIPNNTQIMAPSGHVIAYKPVSLKNEYFPDRNIPSKPNIIPPQRVINPPRAVINTPKNVITTPRNVVNTPRTVVSTPRPGITTPRTVVNSAKTQIMPRSDKSNHISQMIPTPPRANQPMERQIVRKIPEIKQPPRNRDNSMTYYNENKHKLKNLQGSTQLGSNSTSLLVIGNQTLLQNDGTTHLVDFKDVLSYDFSSLDSVFVAFLNSGMMCKIYFGVDKDGVVRGTNCNNRPRRDSYRLTIDRINGRIRPNLIQQCMTVEFVPVCEEGSLTVVVVTIDARNLRTIFCDLSYCYWRRTETGQCVKMNAFDIQSRIGVLVEQEILFEIAALECRLGH